MIWIYWMKCNNLPLPSNLQTQDKCNEPVKTAGGCFQDAEAEPTGMYSRRSYKATAGGLNENISYFQVWARRIALGCLQITHTSIAWTSLISY